MSPQSSEAEPCQIETRPSRLRDELTTPNESNADRSFDRIVQRFADRRADQHLDPGHGVAVLVVPIVAVGRSELDAR